MHGIGVCLDGRAQEGWSRHAMSSAAAGAAAAVARCSSDEVSARRRYSTLQHAMVSLPAPLSAPS